MVSTLGFEERILLIGALTAMVGVFLPWISGEWLGAERTSYSGLSFLTSSVGWAVLLLHAVIMGSGILPSLRSHAVLRRKTLVLLRLLLGALTGALTLAVLTILTNVTFEFSRMEVRFGVYVTLIGSLVVTLYGFLEWQQMLRKEHVEPFHHPEQERTVDRPETHVAPPPPPPPPPLKPEDHHLHG